MENYMSVEFPGKSSNESLARSIIAAFVIQLDVNVEELADIKTAVSEAVTNAIIHGYENTKGIVFLKCKIIDQTVEIVIEDNGKGISDIKKAMQPLYTSSMDGERSGMGFTVMETFMDSLAVESKVGEGTRVTMTRIIKKEPSI